MFPRDKFCTLVFKPSRATNHRLLGPPIVEKDFRYIRELPAVLQCAQPEIPVFKSLNWHCAIVSAVLLPDRTTVEAGGMDEVAVQQSVGVERADSPAICTGPEVLRIPVDDANSRVRVQDFNSTVYPAGSQAVVSIQGKEIFSLRSEDANVPRRGEALVLLPDDFCPLRAQRIHFFARSIIGGAVVHDD